MQAPAKGEAAFQHRHTDTQTHITAPGGGKLGERSAVASRRVEGRDEEGGVVMGEFQEREEGVMALSQCSSELSTSPFSSSQPPVCVTQPMQPCWLVLNPFHPGVTEVTLLSVCRGMLHPGMKPLLSDISQHHTAGGAGSPL